MTQGKLIPGQALIYEKVNGVVYARYRDPPYNNIPKWVIGGDAPNTSNTLFGWQEWQEMMNIAKHNDAMKKQLEKTLLIYQIIKDDQK